MRRIKKEAARPAEVLKPTNPELKGVVVVTKSQAKYNTMERDEVFVPDESPGIHPKRRSPFKLFPVAVGGRRIELVGPEHRFWQEVILDLDASFPGPKLPPGTIVRLIPPEGADRHAELLAGVLRAQGSVVRIDARKRAPREAEPAKPEPRESLRAAVVRVASELETKDRAALLEAVGKHADAVGL